MMMIMMEIGDDDFAVFFTKVFRFTKPRFSQLSTS